MRGGARKFINLEERLEIEKYIKKGYSASEIGPIIGRSKNGVVTEVRRGGGRNYNAIQAHLDFVKRMEERYEKLSEKNKKSSKSYHWTSRIQNLEMQVEILYDTVKELMNVTKN
jgi:IS30 family transposase